MNLIRLLLALGLLCSCRFDDGVPNSTRGDDAGPTPTADADTLAADATPNTTDGGANCIPTGEERGSVLCSDGEDNDCDGDEDSSDAECLTTNVVASSNGGILDSFTSEYCAPGSLPSNCQTGYWNRGNIHDGEYAVGISGTAFRASWASSYKGGGNTPEEFIFSFAGGAAAAIDQIVIQNYGEEGGNGPYYSTHIIVSGEPVGGGEFFPILDTDIATNETVVVFDLALLGGVVDVQRIKLAITSSVDADYWELGEFEALGRLK